MIEYAFFFFSDQHNKLLEAILKWKAKCGIQCDYQASRERDYKRAFLNPTSSCVGDGWWSIHSQRCFTDHTVHQRGQQAALRLKYTRRCRLFLFFVVFFSTAVLISLSHILKSHTWRNCPAKHPEVVSAACCSWGSCFSHSHKLF